MFHIFENKEDRRQSGGSAFIEIQYCRLCSNTKLKKIVSVNSIRNWVEDSLYIFVDDIDSFEYLRVELFQPIKNKWRVIVEE